MQKHAARRANSRKKYTTEFWTSSSLYLHEEITPWATK